jgi:hypothetical protein
VREKGPKGSTDGEYGPALIEIHVGYTRFSSPTGFDLVHDIHKEKKIPVFSMLIIIIIVHQN